MNPLITIVEVNSATIGKCFERMHQLQIRETVAGSNEFGRIMGHIIASRNGLIEMMGKRQVSPVLPIELNWGDFGNFDEASAFDPYNVMPKLDDMEEKHELVTHSLKAALLDVPDTIMKKPAPFPIAFITDQTIGGFMAFMLSHDAYHAGQLSLIVKATTGNALFSEEMQDE